MFKKSLLRKVWNKTRIVHLRHYLPPHKYEQHYAAEKKHGIQMRLSYRD